jgi:hypothetical protein
MKVTKRRPKKLRASPVPQPHSWETIAVGAIVLASAGPRHFEWHEAVVLSVEGETFMLRYAEWPDEPVFTRSREQLALLHHSQRPPPPLEPTKAEPLPVDEAA